MKKQNRRDTTFVDVCCTCAACASAQVTAKRAHSRHGRQLPICEADFSHTSGGSGVTSSLGSLLVMLTVKMLLSEVTNFASSIASRDPIEDIASDSLQVEILVCTDSSEVDQVVVTEASLDCIYRLQGSQLQARSVTASADLVGIGRCQAGMLRLACKHRERRPANDGFTLVEPQAGLVESRV